MSRINPFTIGATVAGLAVVAFAVYAWRKGGIGPAAGELARQVPNVIGSAAGGLVIGAGELVGIPATSRTKCDEALSAGDMWRASFDCDAATFARESWRRFRAPAVDESILDPRDAQARRPADERPPPTRPNWDQYALEGQTWYGAP